MAYRFGLIFLAMSMQSFAHAETERTYRCDVSIGAELVIGGKYLSCANIDGAKDTFRFAALSGGVLAMFEAGSAFLVCKFPTEQVALNGTYTLAHDRTAQAGNEGGEVFVLFPWNKNRAGAPSRCVYVANIAEGSDTLGAGIGAEAVGVGEIF